MGSSPPRTRATTKQSQITLTRHGKDHNIFVITLTGSPHPANVFNIPLLQQLDSMLDKVQAQTPCALIFIGTGKFFSAGFDLKALTVAPHNKTKLNSTTKKQSKTSQGQELVHLAWRILARILVFPVPTITVFNGHAFGLGLFLGLACDHRIMIKHPQRFLRLPEITIGLPLGTGFVALAKCKLNPVALKESALKGKQWTFQEALAHGVVDMVVPPLANGDSVPSEALQLAEILVSTSQKGNLPIIKMELYGETHAAMTLRRSKL